ncbi:MAG TPA: DUF6172 family protein [Opitutus sp.]|nr:DUF6172 family protein [Opitutus sp.]
MKKTFPLRLPGKADARVLDSVRHDVRKYVTRERRKKLPEGHDLWSFDCKVGANADSAETKELADMSAAIGAIAAAGAESVYVEIIARPDHRIPPPAGSAPEPTGT